VDFFQRYDFSTYILGFQVLLRLLSFQVTLSFVSGANVGLPHLAPRRRRIGSFSGGNQGTGSSHHSSVLYTLCRGDASKNGIALTKSGMEAL